MNTITGQTRVLVLMGGPDAEHDVSISSGVAVAESLRQDAAFDVDERVIVEISPEQILRSSPDVVFPVLHGPWGEGGPLQQVLEQVEREHGIPFVGCGSRSAALAMDKWLTKQHLAEAGGIRTPEARLFNPRTEQCPLRPPIVLKPIDDGSSVGVYLCHDDEQVSRAMERERRAIRGPIMAERLVAGRELTVGMLAGEPLPLIEIVPAADFYDYDAKYERDDTRYAIEPDLPDGVQAECCQIAKMAFDLLECRDLARIDLMLDEYGLWLLEVNTMPGFTSHSLLPMAAAAIGLDMAALTRRLVRTALQRGGMCIGDPSRETAV